MANTLNTKLDKDLYEHIRSCYCIAHLATGISFSKLISVALSEFFQYETMRVTVGDRNPMLTDMLVESKRLKRRKPKPPVEKDCKENPGEFTI
jgi:hypothetical protein